MMKHDKKVALPITVPIGDYCWGDSRICTYFDNDGGHSSCALNFWPLEEDKEGRILKPEGCRALKEMV